MTERVRARTIRFATIAVVLASVTASAVILSRDDATPPRSASNPHAPVTVPAKVLNAVDKITLQRSQAELVATGRELFRSSSVAKNGESCNSCHTEGGANAGIGGTPHGPPTGTGAPNDGNFIGLRDPPTLFGVARTDPYFWVGDVKTLNEISIATISNHWINGASRPTLAADAAALTAYMSTIEAPQSNFDRGTMSPAAIRGLELFQGKGACIACHGGSDFTDNLVHNTFVPQRPGETDPGRKAPTVGVCGAGVNIGATAATAPNTVETCAFNTPALRGNGLNRTAPYMHNGAFTTLAQVVEFYNTQSSVAPLGLTPSEKADIVAFLEEL